MAARGRTAKGISVRPARGAGIAAGALFLTAAGLYLIVSWLEGFGLSLIWQQDSVLTGRTTDAERREWRRDRLPWEWARLVGMGMDGGGYERGNVPQSRRIGTKHALMRISKHISIAPPQKM